MDYSIEIALKVRTTPNASDMLPHMVSHECTDKNSRPHPHTGCPAKQPQHEPKLDRPLRQGIPRSVERVEGLQGFAEQLRTVHASCFGRPQPAKQSARMRCRIPHSIKVSSDLTTNKYSRVQSSPQPTHWCAGQHRRQELNSFTTANYDSTIEALPVRSVSRIDSALLSPL